MSTAWPLFSWGSGVLEFMRPAGLLLCPLAAIFFLWLARRTATHDVASTLLWHQVSGLERRRPALWMLAFLFFAALAAAQPRALSLPAAPAADPIFTVAAARHPGEAAEAEAIFAPGAGAVEVTLADARGPLATDRILRAADRPTAWRAPVTAVAAGTPLTLHAAGTSRRAYMPAPPRPLRVFDGSASEAVRDALRALAASSRIEFAAASNAEVGIVRADRFADATGAALRAIVLPAREGTDGTPLPIANGAERHALCAGLDPERWTIARRYPFQDACCAMPTETLLASDAGPLIDFCGMHLRVAFDPEESDLPGRAHWPVLIGRMLEILRPRGEITEPAPSWWRTEWPRLLALLCAALALPIALGARRLAISLALLCLIVATFLVPRPGVGTERRELTAAEAADPRTLLDAARDLPVGGTLVVPPALVLPRERASLLRALRERGVRLEIGGPATFRYVLEVDPLRVAAGSETSILFRGATDRGSGTNSFWAVAPEGTRTEITMPRGPLPQRVSHRPDRAGAWRYEVRDKSAGDALCAYALCWAEGPIDALRLAQAPDTAAAEEGSDILSLAGAALKARAWDTAEPLRQSLPLQPERGIVYWHDLDPAQLTADDLSALRSWIERGGTMMLAAAPRFYSDDAARGRLSTLLPATLPAPPRDPERALGIVLLDLSGSLRESDGFATLLAGVETLLAGTAEDGRWGVAYFRDRPGWIAPPGARVDEALIREVAGAAFSGGTDLAGALAFTLAEFARPEAGRTLVLISDGRQRERADWQEVGARYAAAGVMVWAIGAGAAVDEKTLQAFADGARGRYRRAADPASARELLSAILAPEAGIWRAPAGEISAVPGVSLLRDAPRRLPRPRRALELEARAGARALYADEDGAPLLLALEMGAGRSLLWLSGFDHASLPGEEAGARLLQGLATLLVSATRSEPEAPRAVVRVQDRSGGRWLRMERRPGEPPFKRVRVATMESAGADSGGALRTATGSWQWAVAEEPDGYLISLAANAADNGFLIEEAEGRRAPHIRSWAAERRALDDFLAESGTSPAGPGTLQRSLDTLLLAVAIVIAALAARAPHAANARRRNSTHLAAHTSLI